MADVRFDTYYRYEDLTRILRAFAEEYPNLVRLESIGQSHEGRDVWLVTVTNRETGDDREKPALYVDGNIHATEVSPSSACLHLITTLVTRYGADPEITRCLDSRTFYICPRVNPDGAEWALADRPKVIRSSTRPYPYDEEPIEGLVMEDVDDDGRLLSMRIRDPNGPWKAAPEDPRLMVRRDPTETGGEYYRLLPEGILRNWDGVTIELASRKERLDLNRNFPANWRGEGEQQGSGPFPGSEPEVRNEMAFVSDHPNITGAITFHTFAGVLLRPFDHQNDDNFAAEDLWTYQKIGQKGTDLTGYPNVSVYHDFRYHPREVISGAFDEWMFEHLGVFAWTVEIWSPQRQAGIEEYKFIDWYREHPIEEDLKMLRWSDEVLGGRGYVDWYDVDHPQLGPIQFGGWNQLFAFRNPPAEFLEREIAPLTQWAIWHLLISPRLEVYEANATPLGEDAYRIRLVVQNTGWLPSYISKNAQDKKVVRGLVAEIELPEGTELVTGKARQELDQLEGRAYKPVSATGWGASDPTTDRIKVEWVVRAPQGGAAQLTARHDRAGTVHTAVELTE